MGEETILAYKKEVDCPICPMSDLFTKKWLYDIVLKLNENDVLRYGQLKTLVVGISPKTLTDRLRDLEGYELLTRTVYPEVPLRVEYKLTEKGKDLCDTMLQMCNWVIRWYSKEVDDNCILRAQAIV